MRILILGGTVFLGRALVDSALARGHEITLFNRGRQGPDLFPQVEKLRGDRRDHLSSLAGLEWDAVIDTSGYFPGDVTRSAQVLSTACNLYTFVSSLSVFSDLATTPRMDESGRRDTTTDPGATEITGENYGPLKALCEQAAEEAMPGRTLIVRPGLIVGPNDASDRFTSWPVRVASGGEVLVPNVAGFPVQLIDVRDLAEWMIRMVEADETGPFNATGPDHTLTFLEVMDTCRDVASSDARFVWVDERWLLAAGVTPWTDLPLWVPDAPGFHRADCSKARTRGLTFRPLRETVADTLRWASTRNKEYAWKAGLSMARERELLARWSSRPA